jgi:hypothetical protein
MPAIAGKVTNITGLVQVKDPITGAVTTLKQGDEVFAGSIITSSLDGKITIDLTNGDLLTLGRDTQMALNEDVIGAAAITDPVTEGAVDIEALQLAVLQGNFDTLEATAAEGEATPDASANAGALNSVERTGLEGEVTSGFDTTTSPVVIEQTEDSVIVQEAVVVPPEDPPVYTCDKEIVGDVERSDSYGSYRVYVINDEELVIDLTLIENGTTCITNYDFTDDRFDLSLLIEDSVSGNELDQYLQFEEVSIEVDGQLEDKTVITVDSNGAAAGGDISTIYVDVQTADDDYWKILVDGNLTEYHSD